MPFINGTDNNTPFGAIAPGDQVTYFDKADDKVGTNVVLHTSDVGIVVHDSRITRDSISNDGPGRRFLNDGDTVRVVARAADSVNLDGPDELEDDDDDEEDEDDDYYFEDEEDEYDERDYPEFEVGDTVEYVDVTGDAKGIGDVVEVMQRGCIYVYDPREDENRRFLSLPDGDRASYWEEEPWEFQVGDHAVVLDDTGTEITPRVHVVIDRATDVEKDGLEGFLVSFRDYYKQALAFFRSEQLALISRIPRALEDTFTTGPSVEQLRQELETQIVEAFKSVSVPGVSITLVPKASPSPIAALRPDWRMFYDNSSARRKDQPVQDGFLDYFPAAVRLASELSRLGNEKHNPGEPLHHARGKSTDHGNCIVRHQMSKEEIDEECQLAEAVHVFWRAGAQLQELAEKKYGWPKAPRAK